MTTTNPALRPRTADERRRRLIRLAALRRAAEDQSLPTDKRVAALLLADRITNGTFLAGTRR